MPAVTLTVADLAPFADIEPSKAQAMIDDALARAARVAPCIRDATLSADNAQAAKGVIRDAVLRKNESGSGAMQQQTAGPYSVTMDTRQPRKTLFWPSEIEELQSVCSDHSGVKQSGAFSVDTVQSVGLAGHAPFCDLYFGGVVCSCGYTLTGSIYPAYEL